MSTIMLARNDRAVGRCHLKVSLGAPVCRLTSALEDALRLVSLPGENEGRVYYFRSVHILGVPHDGDRRNTQHIVESALRSEASRAIHGAMPGARHANAVYFNTEEEACAFLLSTLVQQQLRDEWIWAALAPSAQTASPAERAMHALDRLSRTEASWLAVASVFFSARQPEKLLGFVSENRARQWLTQLQPGGCARSGRSPLTLHATAHDVLQRVIRMSQPDDVRVLLIATLAVIFTRPAEMESGSTVDLAQATLQAISTSAASEPCLEVHDSFPEGRGAQQNQHNFLAVTDAAGLMRQGPVPPAQRHCLGEPTEAAGLYFVLNVFRHVRLRVRDRQPQFVAHFIFHLAARLDVPADDAVLLWVQSALAIEHSSYIPHTIAKLMRRVQRWCWKNANMGIAGIVRRRGYVTLTSTHLDITLPLRSAEIRIRRSGLDLDPGWLPWFGRVVHFHYKSQGDHA